MSQWLHVFLLALVQGVTEFLPVSSSGHLAVLGDLFGFRESDALSLGIVLHAGSLTAIVVVYFRELWKFLRPERLHLLLMLVIGTIPAGVAGVLLKHWGWDKMLFGDMLIVGCGFLITGAVLRLTGRARLTARSESSSATTLEKISWRQALIIGFAQMVAVTPGISRSGSTISAGVLCGLERTAAATFSFLLAIPVIGGATLLEMVKLCSSSGSENGVAVPVLMTGFAVSAVVSFGALTLLLRIIRRGKLYWFSWYMFLLGALVILCQLLRLVKGGSGY